jgi:hypothetical protein
VPEKRDLDPDAETVGFVFHLRRGAEFEIELPGNSSPQFPEPGSLGGSRPSALSRQTAFSKSGQTISGLDRAPQTSRFVSAKDFRAVAVMACDDDVIPLQERIAMLYDPRWGWHAAAELGATIR